MSAFFGYLFQDVKNVYSRYSINRLRVLSKLSPAIF